MTPIDYCFEPAQRLAGIPRSCIREILEVASTRKIISFAGGVPADECIPIDSVRESAERVLERDGTMPFRYGSSKGEKELREWIAHVWLRRKGIEAAPEEILIVNGSQQAIDLLGKVVLNKSTPLLVERPTYLAALQAFSVFEPEFLESPMDSCGPVASLFANLLERRNPKAFYTVPNFQNPTGSLMSDARRSEIASLMEKHGTLLIEDDPYGELYYDQPTPRTICERYEGPKALLGTFSKVVAPGFRIGWIHARGELIRGLEKMKQAADLCSAGFGQAILLETLKSMDLTSHLNFQRAFYRKRRNEFAATMDRHLGGWMDWEIPKGGMFFWAKLRPAVSGRELLGRCVQRGVAFGDGASFHAGGGGDRFIRLNFTQTAPTEMEQGIRIIAEEIEAMANENA